MSALKQRTDAGISGPDADMTQCPLLHRKQPSDRHCGMSAMGHKQTHALQQNRQDVSLELPRAFPVLARRYLELVCLEYRLGAGTDLQLQKNIFDVRFHCLG